MDDKRLSMKKLVFTDESGNPGLKDEQGQFVIVGIVVVGEESLRKISEEFSQIKRKMNWNDTFEFKFSKTKKDIIMRLLERCCEIDFEIYALIFEKKAKTEKGQTTYNRLLCELVKEINMQDLEIIIDGKTSRINRNKTAAFLRKQLSLNGNKIRYGNSKSYDGLQLADLVAGAIHRFYAGKKGGETFLSLIKSKIKMILRK